jgi:hypothetical protein
VKGLDAFAEIVAAAQPAVALAFELARESAASIPMISLAFLTTWGQSGASRAHWLLLASLLTLSTLDARADADTPKVAPEGPVWSAAAGFYFDEKADKKRESLSGIACPSTVPRLCVAAFDEGIEARYVEIDGNRLVPQPDKIVLLPGGKELDAEGAARDGDP